VLHQNATGTPRYSPMRCHGVDTGSGVPHPVTTWTPSPWGDRTYTSTAGCEPVVVEARPTMRPLVARRAHHQAAEKRCGSTSIRARSSLAWPTSWPGAVEI